MTACTAAALQKIGLVAIIRADSSENLLDAARALQHGGIGALEVTLNTPRALQTIASLRAELPTMRIGAGTVLSPDDAGAAIAAGAQFIVTPVIDAATIRACRDAQAPILCGCGSPSEVARADAAGADFIKLFPAGSFGLDYIRALLGPFPHLKLMPTGGVTLDNLGDFLRAGCVGAAIGGNLVSKQILREGAWDELTHLAAQFVQTLATARESGP